MSPSSDFPVSPSTSPASTSPASHPLSLSETGENPEVQTLTESGDLESQEPAIDSSQGDSQENASYVKLAMRNMVRKGGKSLTHFFLTTLGLVGLFVGLSYLTR